MIGDEQADAIARMVIAHWANHLTPEECAISAMRAGWKLDPETLAVVRLLDGGPLRAVDIAAARRLDPFIDRVVTMVEADIEVAELEALFEQ